MTSVAGAAISGESTFPARVMAGRAFVTSTITRFIAMKVVEGLSSVFRNRPVVSMTRIESVVDMAEEPVRSVKPRACPNKNPAHKPIGPIVTVGGAVIGCVVEIPIGAHRCHSDTDCHLGRSHRSPAHHDSCQNCTSEDFHCCETRKCKSFAVGHDLLLNGLEDQGTG